jgi:hypothetical protein
MAFSPYSTASKALAAGATLQNDLPEITGELADVVSAAMREKVEEMAAAASSAAPVGDPMTDPNSGRLSDSIQVEEYNEPGAVGWRVVVTAENDNVQYGHVIEKGATIRGRYHEPQPFLYGELDSRVADTVSAVQKALEDL